MFKKTVVLTTLLALGLATHTGAGGRATVIVWKAPKEVSAGASFQVAFRVRPEIGRRNVEPVLRAVHEGLTVEVAPVAKGAQQYVASVRLPKAGEWRITVDSRYCETRMAPLTIKVIDPKDKLST